MSYSQQQHNSASSSDGHNQQSVHQNGSPLDWTNFMAFNTASPPVSANSAGSGKVLPVDGREQYHAFAQGIAMNNPPPTAMNFRQPFPRQQSQTQQYAPNPSPRQQNIPLQQQTPRSRSSADESRINNNGKGKSPVIELSTIDQQSNMRRSSSQSTAQTAHSDLSQPSLDNGLTLDPSAFSRELRFQVPSFLAPSTSGAPTFPPGGEAWSGYSGPHMFGNSNNLSDQYCDPSSGQAFDGQQRNVLDGLSGFMAGDNWEAWGDQTKDGVVSGGAGMTPNIGYTFYTNPNPSPGLTSTRNNNGTDYMGYQNMQPRQDTQNTGYYQPDRSQSITQSPRSTQTNSTSMPTSAILPQQTFPQSNFPVNAFPSVSLNNIASSSTAPYAPPSNTSALLSTPSSTFIGPSVADGPGLYSTTGFDMMGVLSRVANRKDPKTVLGPVDFSCSFLVVDIRKFDSPIVYCSPTFSSLTGYDATQILGRNCRFLQSPEGEVVKGSKRKYTDNVAVAHLKRMLNAGKECQASLINYRRGGVPFINLVTIVPIPWDGTDIVYHVGFQVDLVEQPNAILRNMQAGSYQVNYCLPNPPQPPLPKAGKDGGTIGLSKEVLDVLGSRVNASGFGQGEEGGKVEWLKMVLENADDFVHVLSLKGSFQYVSPSVRRVLEYDPEDLINKNVSDLCHPSDIVPLMRELKDSTHAPADGQAARPVNLVFRIRRKNSGYVWIECTGRLHVEPGKGRKAVILSGRARNVPTLSWGQVAHHGGLGEIEFWSKLSHQGLIIHSTSSVSNVLGQPADDVVGQSFFSLLPGGDNGPSKDVGDSTSPVALVSKALQSTVAGDTRNGGIAIQHQMVRKSGSQVDVVSVFYNTSGSRASPANSPSSDVSTQSKGSNYVVVQTKVVLSPPSVSTTLSQTTHSKPVVHSPSSNVFEELETTRGTSWQYELHQLRLLNRRLRDDIAAARAALARGGKLKGKKRKMGEEVTYRQNLGVPMGPPPVPKQEPLTVVPKHQMTPGFGLMSNSSGTGITPGMPFTYF